jgi:hypothetical protein
MPVISLKALLRLADQWDRDAKELDTRADNAAYDSGEDVLRAQAEQLNDCARELRNLARSGWNDIAHGTNTVAGDVTGSVVQVGNVKGQVNL